MKAPSPKHWATRELSTLTLSPLSFSRSQRPALRTETFPSTCHLRLPTAHWPSLMTAFTTVSSFVSRTTWGGDETQRTSGTQVQLQQTLTSALGPQQPPDGDPARGRADTHPAAGRLWPSAPLPWRCGAPPGSSLRCSWAPELSVPSGTNSSLLNQREGKGLGASGGQSPRGGGGSTAGGRGLVLMLEPQRPLPPALPQATSLSLPLASHMATGSLPYGPHKLLKQGLAQSGQQGFPSSFGVNQDTPFYG